MAPWLAYPSLKWSSEDSEFYPTHDRTGKPILNSAGDIFDPSPSIPLPTPIATITRVEQGFLPIWITQFKGTVNAAPWMGFPAESVLCKDITADSSTDSDWGILYNVTYTFAFRPPILASDGVTIMVAGWDAFIANVGKRQLVDGKREEIRDKDGQSISDPVPLQLVDGTYDEDDPKTYYLRFPVYPTSDFSYFNFPANLFSYVP
ncbi:MAG: hypothetical protein BGO49_24925 [Planctomycetales bacterium 71-10]|nr:MAG: hypothetical protein BGO49_24925 [Planctomycetales bacterium 71-10]